MGVTNELPAAHLFKRLTMIEMTLGDTDHHLQRFIASSAGDGRRDRARHPDDEHGAGAAAAGGLTSDDCASPRYAFEDFEVGSVIPCGPRTVTADEIVAFATQFDPQPFHVDEEAGRRSIYGSLIASGWHTASMVMRMGCDCVPARLDQRRLAGRRPVALDQAGPPRRHDPRRHRDDRGAAVAQQARPRRRRHRVAGLQPARRARS